MVCTPDMYHRAGKNLVYWQHFFRVLPQFFYNRLLKNGLQRAFFL